MSINSIRSLSLLFFCIPLNSSQLSPLTTTNDLIRTPQTSIQKAIDCTDKLSANHLTILFFSPQSAFVAYLAPEETKSLWKQKNLLTPKKHAKYRLMIKQVRLQNNEDPLTIYNRLCKARLIWQARKIFDNNVCSMTKINIYKKTLSLIIASLDGTIIWYNFETYWGNLAAPPLLLNLTDLNDKRVIKNISLQLAPNRQQILCKIYYAKTICLLYLDSGDNKLSKGLTYTLPVEEQSNKYDYKWLNQVKSSIFFVGHNSSQITLYAYNSKAQKAIEARPNAIINMNVFLQYTPNALNMFCMGNHCFFITKTGIYAYDTVDAIYCYPLKFWHETKKNNAQFQHPKEVIIHAEPIHNKQQLIIHFWIPTMSKTNKTSKLKNEKGNSIIAIFAIKSIKKYTFQLQPITQKIIAKNILPEKADEITSIAFLKGPVIFSLPAPHNKLIAQRIN